MNFFALYFFCVLTFLTSCNGQNSSSTTATNQSIGSAVEEFNNSIWIVFQASNGDYWFGTDTDGVYRYDGETLTHFSTEDGLSNERVRGIQEDNYGHIFISTVDGINKYDGDTIVTLPVVKSNSPDENWDLQPDDLWFSSVGQDGSEGPFRYDGTNLYQLKFPKHYLADDYFKRFPNTSWSPYDVYYIYKDSNGVMWFGTSNLGVGRYDGVSHSWLYEDHLTNTPQGGSFGIRSILEDSDGKFWFSNSRYRYTITSGITTDNDKVLVNYEKETGIDNIKTVGGFDHIYFSSVVEDDQGNMWMVTYDQGVWKYDGNNVIQYPVKDGERNVTLFSIYKDRKGDLWLGSHESGAYKFNGVTFEKFSI